MSEKPEMPHKELLEKPHPVKTHFLEEDASVEEVEEAEKAANRVKVNVVAGVKVKEEDVERAANPAKVAAARAANPVEADAALDAAVNY